MEDVRRDGEPRPSIEDLLDEAAAAVRVRDHEHALKLLQPLAESGNAEAQCEYGILLDDHKHDRAAATTWFKRSAEQGDAHAILLLCALYHINGPDDPNLEEGLKWTRLASGRRFYAETWRLADLYEKGWGVPRDPAKAARLRRMGDEQKKNPPRLRSGFRNPNCPGVLRVFARALEREKRAAESGDAKAQTRVGDFYYNGEGRPVDFAEALKWYHKAAEQDEPMALWRLGDMYSCGEGVPKSEAEAFKWYARTARHKGHFAATNSMLAITMMLDKRQDFPGRDMEIYKWCLLAEEGGIRVAGLAEKLERRLTPNQIAEIRRQCGKSPEGER